MYLRSIKFGNSFLLILLFFFLGYTHFLGGPYWLAKFLFFVMIFGTLFISIFITGLSMFAGRALKKRMKIFRNSKEHEKDNETIKVDAKIVE